MNWKAVEDKEEIAVVVDEIKIDDPQKVKELSEVVSKPRRGRPGKQLSSHDPVNHPAHYTTGGIETIDFIEAKNLNYHLGNVIKYITRADYKGRKIEDLEKAAWYLNREIARLKEQQ